MRKINILSLIVIAIMIQSYYIQAKPIAFVSIPPQKYLLDILANDLLDTNVLLQPGQSPETFDPSPRQMAQLSKSKLYFTLGLSFEQIILKRIVANNKELEVINTVKTIDQSTLQFDPHTWLDPVLFESQAYSIYLSLQKLLPQHKKELENNFQLLQQQFKELKIAMDDLFLNKNSSLNKNRPGNKNNFVIFHPALSHFARRYQLNQVPIEHEGKHSSAKYLADLMSILKRQSVKYVLVEKQFGKKEAQTVAKVLQAKLLEIDPLAESWLDNMYDIANKVHQALY
jgi:zinc transport system substrate-binding protein